MRASDPSSRRLGWGLAGCAVAGVVAVAVLGSGVAEAVPSSTALHDDAVSAAVAASQQLAAGKPITDVAEAVVARVGTGDRDAAVVQGTRVIRDSGPPPSVPAYALSAAAAGQDVRLIVNRSGGDRMVVVIPVAVPAPAPGKVAPGPPLVVVSAPLRSASVVGAAIAAIIGVVLGALGFALGSTSRSRRGHGDGAATAVEGAGPPASPPPAPQPPGSPPIVPPAPPAVAPSA